MAHQEDGPPERERPGIPPSTAPAAAPRREFLKLALALSGVGAGKAGAERAAGGVLPPAAWPRYVLRRQTDGIYMLLEAVGYRETRVLEKRWLTPVAGAARRLLVFGFPPQHFAETAIAVTTIPAVLAEDQLARLALLESQPSQLILRDPGGGKLQLRLEELLDWRDFELVLPDKDDSGNPVATTPPYALAVDPAASPPASRVEMPWGVELLPAGTGAPDPGGYLWRHPLAPATRHGWTELWTTALTRRDRRPLAMEVLSIRGFAHLKTTGSVTAGDLQLTYTNAAGTPFPANPTALNNYDRLNLAANLSRRFPYTGKGGATPVESAMVVYQNVDGQPGNACLAACYAENRTVSVEQYRLSALGGWLKLEGQWQAFPGCALSGWTHVSGLGRDHRVQEIAAGFLYPFGTPCQLSVLAERVFVRDARGHFVAPVIKQAFLQIQRENTVAPGHAESPFTSLTVSTQRTPPLDLPASGDPATYLQYDFFLPMVEGKPFVFEHVGVDWAGDAHMSGMPMYFVSNKARSANGLIWEPGYSWSHSQRTAPCDPPPPGPADAPHTIPKTGDGLQVIDKLWNQQAFRFAQYNRTLAALAAPLRKGDTSQRLEWVEWTRGNTAPLAASPVAGRPFLPRARTMKLRLEGMAQMSGQASAVIATYRDTRAAAIPLLDPQPTSPAALYQRNVQPGAAGEDAPYLYLLEARPLRSEAAAVAPSTPAARALQMRDSYYGCSSSTLPAALFADLDNEISFGKSSNAEAVGGVAVPDTHASILTRRHGPVGDATFNERRWPGYAGKQGALAAAGRVDFAGFRRQHRKHIDSQPFDPVRSEAELTAYAAQARAFMGFPPLPAALAAGPAPAGLPHPGLKLGDLFGADAEILPGLPFSTIFQAVAFGDVPDGPALLGAGGKRTAEAPAWNVRLTGIDHILALAGSGPGQRSLPELLRLMAEGAHPAAVAEPLRAGMEATLHWEHDIFNEVDVGFVKFTPGNTQIAIDASSKIDLGRVAVSSDLRQLQFAPGQASVSARTVLSDFSITLFQSIIVRFARVAFELDRDGRKDFSTQIADIALTGPLAFVNELQAILGGLGGGQGIKTDLSPDRILLSQTLRFPAQEGQPLFIGPAQVINLALSWSLSIPLRGRDVLSVGFAISSREKPLTIFVPPWYGGKAHVLLELTTKGCRLIEVSLEFGAVIPVTWTLASGVASITAGIFYLCRRTPAGGEVVLTAFVKAACDLSVARVIHFSGLLYIALSSKQGGGGKVLIGETTTRVSIKIGFVRVSYSFTATREERSHDAAFAAAALGGSTGHAIDPFGRQFDKERRAAFERLIRGYSSMEQVS